MLMPSIFNDNLFDNFFEDFPRVMRYRELPMESMNVMKTDVKELDDGYELSIDLPGVKKEDIQAELSDGYLTISATHGSDKEQKDDNGKFIRRERYCGSASRRFYVGDHVKQEDIKARFENGILRLDIPKIDPSNAVEEKKTIAIEG